MKSRPLLKCLAMAVLAVLSPLHGVKAQQAPTYVPPPQQQQPPPGYAPPTPRSSYYVSPLEFLPTFGRKFGEMFRRVFYGDAPPRGYAPPPNQGRSLDQPPSGYPRGAPPPPPSQAYPPQPRYETPQPSYETPQPRYETPPAPQPGANPSTRSEPPPTPRPPTRSQPSVTPTVKSPAPPPQAASKPSATKPARETVTSPPKMEPKPSSKTVADAPPPSTPEKKPEAAPSGGAFLKGKKTNKPGRVISPYPPYQELDVSGLSSGSLALDPTTQKVFEVP